MLLIIVYHKWNQRNIITFYLKCLLCGRPFDEVLESARRDNWLNSQEALDFGLIDEIVTTNESTSVISLLDGSMTTTIKKF
jgi:ATP-dependent protease ClpP protease subunit